MLRYLLPITLLCFSSYYFVICTDLEGEQVINVNDFSHDSDASDLAENTIEDIIENIENLAAQAEKTIKEGILPIENTEDIYSKMEERIEELVDLTLKTLNIYKFLNAKGIERIVLPNLGVNFVPLKKQLLLLIKNLFNVAPISTNAVIPIGVVDKVLDIFEYDNLALKAHALDILYLWLPGNPKVQTRVMKMKGLEPFYNQVEKLDAGVIDQLLDLFNKILEEHIQARRKDMQRSKADQDKLKLYQRIGLIERLSMPNVCYGLLNILETTWPLNIDEKEIPLQIFKIIKNVRPYCINTFKIKTKRSKFFDKMLEYVNDPKRSSYLEKLGINITDTQLVLTEYSSVFKAVRSKDEL